MLLKVQPLLHYHGLTVQEVELALTHVVPFFHTEVHQKLIECLAMSGFFSGAGSYLPARFSCASNCAL